MGQTSFFDYAEEIKQRQNSRARKTYLGARLHIGRLQVAFRDKALDEIDDGTWTQYCERRRISHPKCSLYDDRKWLLRIMLSAQRERLIPYRVFLTDFYEPSEVGRELSEEEIAKLKIFADPKLLFQMNIALEMGLRKGEMLKLRWEQIDFKRRIVRLSAEETKTRRSRIVPIPSHIFDRLSALYAKECGARFVFKGHNNPRKAQDDVKYGWVLCKRKAGVHNARWHDLRHTAASRMVRSGAPDNSICRMLGMSSKVLRRIYCHINDQDLWNVLEKVEKLKTG